MSTVTIMPNAPLCFSHPSILGTANNGGFAYIARGTPNLTKIIPEARKPDWKALAQFGAPAALQVTDDTYVEVRALPGAFFDLYNRQVGELQSWSAGSFLFPANGIPMLMGAFKCFRVWTFDGAEIPSLQRSAISIASVGHRSAMAIYNSELGKCGGGKPAYAGPFASCIALAYVPYIKRPDDAFSTALKSIKGISRLAGLGGARARFRDIFGSGSRPVQREGQIRFFVPENVSDAYDNAVPLKRLEIITRRDLLIGYDRFRSRFISRD